MASLKSVSIGLSHAVESMFSQEMDNFVEGVKGSDKTSVL